LAEKNEKLKHISVLVNIDSNTLSKENQINSAVLIYAIKTGITQPKVALEGFEQSTKLYSK